MSSPNYPPKTCALEGCNRPLMRRNESIAEWARRKYCSLRCVRRANVPPINHGSRFGAQQHRRRGEKPCEVCYAAEGEYKASLREADPSVYEGHKMRQNARAKAMRKLAAMFPDEFDALFEREMTRLLASNTPKRLVAASSHPGRRSSDTGSGNTGERGNHGSARS